MSAPETATIGIRRGWWHPSGETPRGWSATVARVWGGLALHPAPGEPGRWAVTHVRTGREVASSADAGACAAFCARWGAWEGWAAIDGPVAAALLPGDLFADLARLVGAR